LYRREVSITGSGHRHAKQAAIRQSGGEGSFRE
jgi:hypothetical protein